MFTSVLTGLTRRRLRKTMRKLRMMRVADIVNPDMITCLPEDSVVHAATKMIAEDISCLIVMKHGQLRGIITERDYLQKVPLNRKVFNMRVEDIMTPDVVTVRPDTLLSDAVRLMQKHNFRRLVVELNNGGVGLATQTDFTNLIIKLFPKFPIHRTLEVQSIMTRKVLTASSKESFSVAREKMQRINVGSILIMDKGVPEGIFTEYDVVMQFYDQEGRLDVKELSAYMRRYVRAAGPTMSVFEANKLLAEKRMRRLPVVDGEKVVGIVTQTDLVRFIFPEMDVIDGAIEEAESFGVVKKEYAGRFVGDHLKVY